MQIQNSQDNFDASSFVLKQFQVKKKLGNQCQWVKEESNKIELASVVGRKVGNFKLPFSSSLKIEQFGMPLLMGRLAEWKKLYLSKGGKGHSQQKHVIFPSQVCHVTCHYANSYGKYTVNKMEKLQRDFLWEGQEMPLNSIWQTRIWHILH